IEAGGPSLITGSLASAELFLNIDHQAHSLFRLRLGRGLVGVCSFSPAKTARSSASLYPLPSFLLMRAALSQPGALWLYDCPRRDTSQPIPSSSFSRASKSAGFCSRAWSIITRSVSRWDCLARSPSHLL